MPKMKSNRGAAKRFKVTGSGKVRYNHSFKSHFLTKKARGRKRKLAKGGIISAVDEKRVLRMIQE